MPVNSWTRELLGALLRRLAGLILNPLNTFITQRCGVIIVTSNILFLRKSMDKCIVLMIFQNTAPLLSRGMG
uniref:Uncharacterized protein n=1 Tax=Onchocerca volvulus TaxID=6282 RepID=A0A8R1XU71_ONCVO